MQVRMVIFPSGDDLDVGDPGKGRKERYNHRHFDYRSGMIAMLGNLSLLDH